jgi:hypothetical protein
MRIWDFGFRFLSYSKLWLGSHLNEIRNPQSEIRNRYPHLSFIIILHIVTSLIIINSRPLFHQGRLPCLEFWFAPFARA